MVADGSAIGKKRVAMVAHAWFTIGFERGSDRGSARVSAGCGRWESQPHDDDTRAVPRVACLCVVCFHSFDAQTVKGLSFRCSADRSVTALLMSVASF